MRDVEKSRTGIHKYINTQMLLSRLFYSILSEEYRRCIIRKNRIRSIRELHNRSKLLVAAGFLAATDCLAAAHCLVTADFLATADHHSASGYRAAADFLVVAN